MLRTLCLVVVVVAGCKGKEAKKDEPAKPVVALDAAAEAPKPPAAKDERCTTPCRFLADTPLAEVADKFKTACSADWPQTGPKDCAQLDYQRNCIFATAGYTFKKKRYQDAFGKESWYKARADFKDADLSKVATANVAELKSRAGECRKGGVIDDKDRKAVEAWLAKLQAGKPEKPEIIVEYGGGNADEFMKSLVAMKKQFAPKQLRGMRYIEQADLMSEWVEPLEGKTIRKFVEADFSEPDDGKCGDEECGYGLALVFAIDDKDKIVGIEEQAAACPVVYANTTPLGEIIRNMNLARRETTQSLAVPDACGRVTYRIVEEKAETTHLDELVLVVGDDVLLPSPCGALCANDGRAEILEQGDSREVTFDVPHCGSARLVANGHYLARRSKR